MKRVIFNMQLTGLGDTVDDARRDAIEQLSNTVHDHVEITSWLDVEKVEDVED